MRNSPPIFKISSPLDSHRSHARRSDIDVNVMSGVNACVDDATQKKILHFSLPNAYFLSDFQNFFTFRFPPIRRTFAGASTFKSNAYVLAYVDDVTSLGLCISFMS